MRRRHRLISLTAACLLALVLKAAYLAERVHLPDLRHPTMDAKFHDEWATGLATGIWTQDLERIRDEPYFRAPLYPYFVSGVYRIFGRDPAAVLVVQLLLAAASTCLMFLLCDALFGVRAAWAGALIFAAYWPLTYFDGEMLTASLEIVLALGFLLAVIHAVRSGGLRDGFLAGLLLGLAAITRPNMLILAPVALVWITRPWPVRRWRRAAALAIGAAVVVVPVTVRNVVVGRDAVLIASQGGGNFYIGNNPGSNGSTAVIPGTRADWWGGFDDWRRIASEAGGRALRPSEVSSYWYRRGAEFLIREPAAAARLYVRKLTLLLGNGEVSNQEQMYFARGRSGVLSRLPVNFAAILALSSLGLACLLRARDRRLLIPHAMAAAYALTVLAFFVSSRHRLPFAVFLMPGAAVGLVVVMEHLRSRRWREVIPVAVLAGTLLGASMANPLQVGALAQSRGYYSLAIDYMNSGNLPLALASLNQSIHHEESYAPSWAVRGRVRDRMGDSAGGLADLERACRLDTTLADAFLRRGVILQKLNRHDDAMACYERSLALDPRRAELLNNMADVSFRRGDPDRALRFLQRALAVDSTFANALFGMGHYHERAGNIDRAIMFYRGAGEFEPARVRLSEIETAVASDEPAGQER